MPSKNKEYTRKLLKKLKNKKLRKYKKRKKTSFLSSKRNLLNQSENQKKISLITMKLLENRNKNRELKNEL